VLAKARVLFIYPNLNTQEGFNHGIAALSGALKAAGAETKLLNLNNTLLEVPDREEILETVRDFDPDLICFSVMTQQYKYALSIAKDIKERFAFPIAVGGVHASMVPDEICRDGVFDYVCVGECDRALPALLEAIKQEKDVTSIPNVWARREDEWVRNPVGPFPKLEDLPPKDFEIFELDRMLAGMNGWMSLLTSRGCPYRCTYCFNHKIVQRYKDEGGDRPAAYLRRYPLERILGEAETLVRDHPGIKTFIFDDDLFTLDEKAVIDFCRGYKALDLGVPFVVNAHVQSFSRPMAEALREAGCLILKFGIESGSERIRRDVLKRRMSNDQIAEAFGVAHDAGLHTSAFLMFGLPLEEREDVEATIDLVARIKPGRFRWAVFYPFPGTEIHDLCVENKLIDPEKAKRTETFYEESCLRLAPETDLLIRKLQRCFHWYVNARADLGDRGAAGAFQELVADIEALDASGWAARSEGFLEEERALSDSLKAAGKLHYSIRFTQVMAVRSDFEESNEGFSRPAKEWGRKAGEGAEDAAGAHRTMEAGTQEGTS
jgi:radical SAM superfamily enzyme YgiQ (UPF0313 family)